MGGPTTIEGKQIVSKNALKHGATSKRLLNSEDQALYTQLIEDLNAQYATSNPLAKFQIERIARINVQLQRIQDAIDANFEISRIEFNGPEKSLDLEKGLNSGSMKLGQKPNFEIEYDNQFQYSLITNKTYISLATELIDNNFSGILTHEGFLNKCPKFCDYLFQQSQLENLTIQNFMSEKFPSREDRWRGMEKMVYEMSKTHSPELHTPPPAGISKAQAIFNTELFYIRRTAQWLVEEKNLIQTYKQKAAEHKRLKEIKVLATIPELAKLDSLMRYQTSLQRQLSTAMGELLAIIEN